MRKSSDIKGLFEGHSERLTSLKRQVGERSRILTAVAAALPSDLAASVATAGIKEGTLFLGAVSAAWATRLRYEAAALQQHVGTSLGVEIAKVRVRVTTAPRTAGEP
jgi:hypothetical protein